MYKKFICLYASDNDWDECRKDITLEFITKILEQYHMFDGDHTMVYFRDGVILMYVPSRRDILFRRFNGN